VLWPWLLLPSGVGGLSGVDLIVISVERSVFVRRAGSGVG